MLRRWPHLEPRWHYTEASLVVLEPAPADDDLLEPEEAESYASDNGIFFMETSAKTATNVNELFVAIARKLPKNTPQPRAGGQGLVIATDTRGSETKKGCC